MASATGIRSEPPSGAHTGRAPGPPRPDRLAAYERPGRPIVELAAEAGIAMIAETPRAVLARTVETGAALARVPLARTPLMDGDTGISMVVELNDYNTVSATAAYLGYSEKQIRDWLTGGSLTGERWGRQWRITRAAVEAFIETRRTAPIPAPETAAATDARRRQKTPDESGGKE